jgi:hypothetical protein
VTIQLFAVLIAVFVLGLFIGTNAGVLLMCVLRIAGTRND